MLHDEIKVRVLSKHIMILHIINFSNLMFPHYFDNVYKKYDVVAIT